jgi:vacuolar-type H+-ATPase subunit F/Vma7
MGRIAVIGESVRVQALALAGVLVLPGDEPDQCRSHWRELPADVDLVILTPEAAAAVGESSGPLQIVMPP